MLRSNCRVTNQPDWGDLYIEFTGSKFFTLESLAQYIVGMRKVNHFHEEVVEMIYKDLLQFEPENLFVTAFYTRRGGIDINPVRASSENLIPKPLVQMDYLNKKTLRQ